MFVLEMGCLLPLTSTITMPSVTNIAVQIVNLMIGYLLLICISKSILLCVLSYPRWILKIKMLYTNCFQNVDLCHLLNSSVFSTFPNNKWKSKLLNVRTLSNELRKIPNIWYLSLTIYINFFIYLSSVSKSLVHIFYQRREWRHQTWW